ncbi:MAG: exported protein of unknown function [Promethearchaeota archaeon]|nr:MAG: exported protein of unknown function [Candidatus Lokiarchaeota archaeon]
MLKKRKTIFTICLVSFLFFSNLLVGHSQIFADFKPNKLIQTNDGGLFYSNATIISDGHNGIFWNDDICASPKLVADNEGRIHAVWHDYTAGPWGTDIEIMYSIYTKKTGWTYPIVISDGYNGSYWNGGESYCPSLAVDDDGGVHVVWFDYSEGFWGGGWDDPEIMYVKFVPGYGWSNVTIISDMYDGSYWNHEQSKDPSLDIDNEGCIHVVWEDWTDGSWRKDDSDCEIMYVKYTPEIGWSNITIVSDGYKNSYWNSGRSIDPCLTIDKKGTIHVVWQDETTSSWGGGFEDSEIMYTQFNAQEGWLNATVISDGYGGIYWNNGKSRYPSLDTDTKGGIHVVWEDETMGPWGGGPGDLEIMYTQFNAQEGWSNVTIISDGYGGSYQNGGESGNPQIVLDEYDGVHVVWDDKSYGLDSEIVYCRLDDYLGWTYPLVVSDGYGGTYWNNGTSSYPTLTINNGKLYVAWSDNTFGPWRDNENDYEIMTSIIENSIESINQRIPGAFSLSSDADTPDEDGIFNLKWTKSEYAEEYSIHYEKNNTIEEYATGLLERTYTVIGLSNGNYTFHIKAHNQFGSTSSNKLNISINVPSSDNTTSDSDDTTDEDTTDDDINDGNGSISLGNWYLGFLSLAIIGISIITVYRQRK